MLKKALISFLLIVPMVMAEAANVTYHISLKKPGNTSVKHALTAKGNQLVDAQGKALPIDISYSQTTVGGETTLTVTLQARERVYYNIGMEVATGYDTDQCDFYLPGFWYHQNLRSPNTAPSFHVAKSWNVREDRLSAPLSGVFSQQAGASLSVLRQIDAQPSDALIPLAQGEVILGGPTSLGYVGFDNETGKAKLTFGYPYIETPKRYTRKLTLTPAIYTFAKLDKGEKKTLTWTLHEGREADYGKYVADTWNYCFDRITPQPIKADVNVAEVKKNLTGYFRESYVDKYDLKYNSGLSLLTDKCEPANELELGFCGRVLLNAFNELEYGEANNDAQLVQMGRSIFDSFLHNGFTEAGYIYDRLNYGSKQPWGGRHSIRQQSEGIYAILHMLKYDKNRGKLHRDWEKRVRTILDNFVRLQNADGSFPRKFMDDGSVVDKSGGSTPSATVPLVMAYKYFGDKRYLKAAERTIDYLEKNIIAKSDYFSSTLDANCEDKEAAISAVTATYYMALVTKGKARQHYIDLCRESTYFALSWYYLWDVPFAQGQMLGDLGLKSRGWGNVSVENNHIDVFVFEFGHILKWLGQQTADSRFAQMYKVIYTSMDQLMPTAERHCGIAKPGFYPEVVQHTHWDYGRNGKGFYNNYFAPGWTIASLWELYTPTRTESFFKK